jgi:hypothetical protein
MSSDDEDDAQLRDELRELQELLGVNYRDAPSQSVRNVSYLHSQCRKRSICGNDITIADCSAAAGNEGSAVGRSACSTCSAGAGVGGHRDFARGGPPWRCSPALTLHLSAIRVLMLSTSSMVRADRRRCSRGCCAAHRGEAAHCLRACSMVE